MTICAAYTGPTTAGLSVGLTSLIAGKILGELLAIRQDLQERISQLEGPNDWHNEPSFDVPGAQHRDVEMQRLARLRADFAYVTNVIAAGGSA